MIGFDAIDEQPDCRGFSEAFLEREMHQGLYRVIDVMTEAFPPESP
mgnify:CR=1 FL=1